MSFLFAIIGLLSIFGLIFGLINPKKAVFWSKNKTRVNVVKGYLGAIIISFVLVGLSSPKETNKQASVQPQSTDKVISTMEPTATPAVTPIAQPTPEPTQKPPEDIKEFTEYIIKAKLNKESNFKTPKLVSTMLTDGILFIELNADDGISNNSIVSKIQDEDFRLLKELSKKDGIKSISISHYYPMQNSKTGKQSDEIGYSVSISGDNLKKVAWENLSYSKIPNIVDTVFIHPVLQK